MRKVSAILGFIEVNGLFSKLLHCFCLTLSLGLTACFEEPKPVEESKLKEYQHVVSLGHNCHVSTALNALYGTTERFPWDWNWSTPAIIIDNIEDNFKKYLDKNKYVKCSYWAYNPTNNTWERTVPVGGECTGHLDYGYFFFRHQDLFSEKGYESFERRVDRFLKLKKPTAEPILFIYAAVAEQTPRLGSEWKSSEAFGTGDFQFADYKDDSEIYRLYNILKENFVNFKFLVIINDWSATLANLPFFNLDKNKSRTGLTQSLDYYYLYTKTKNDHCLYYPNTEDNEKFISLIKKYQYKK